MKQKKSNTKKYLIWIGIPLVILLIVFAVNKKSTADETKVSTELVTKRTIIETVSANGKIQPEIDVKISPYISGEVVELYVKEGDEVKEGKLLAKIDPEIYISSYERAEAALNTQKANQANAKARLAQVQAQFVNAELSYNRNKTLFDQNVVSKSDIDAALAAFKVAEAEVEAAKESLKAAEFSVGSTVASLKEAKENLNRTSIYAPNDGTVSKLNVEKGERVTGASQFSSGTEIMTVANLQNMEVNVEVNENDIVRVSLFDTCLIEVDAYLNKKFKGIVTEIATSANVTGVSADQVTNFQVKIRILRESYAEYVSEDNPNYSPFRPGMSATVDIQTETAFEILTLPIQAVTTRSDSSGKPKVVKAVENKDEPEVKVDEEAIEYVFMYTTEGIAKMVKVKTGIQNNTYIQILEGLKEGDEIIVAPYRAVSKKLKDGDAVKKVPKDELFVTTE
ncbi:MAG: efflux RND transporter periplasmic adaptor subunit [Bacteroidetes bacterium HGW-Bacteroidetes-17]|jgi:HlyD family secretion protein|nr:MAG: efflux RND transporter periplasmic adaptor subunit [Bacteroidetes bacterium HGW-Bacteroidetes-17]